VTLDGLSKNHAMTFIYPATTRRTSQTGPTPTPPWWTQPSQTANPHGYEDPDATQTVKVEPTMADRAEQSQSAIDNQAAAVEKQFQQQLVSSVSAMLDKSEAKIEAEGMRYGFPNNESIFNPKRSARVRRLCCRRCPELTTCAT